MTAHSHEPHNGPVNNRLNWLRAGVLGANDGIVSVASVVIGVAAAAASLAAIVTAGIAALAGGAVSMALGEYVSVSTQRDTERALLEKERRELDEIPDEEFVELVGLYEDKGLSRDTAVRVATELTERDAFAAHVDIELGIDPDELTNPWAAAVSSAIAFTVGALLPLLAVWLTPHSLRIPVTVGAVLAALVVTGWLSATLGGADRAKAVIRVVLGGAIAMAVTFVIGRLFGAIA